ncbi:MAG TPA: ABC transporter permease [Candidatus Faecaligallichristensenella faecipullorum]|nr:ABC transporter permease [Candidatus Faecaligallichristensenella faecipullorum]
MLKYTLKRILMAIPVILGIVTIVFVLMRVFSSNPAYLLLGQRASAERVAELTSYLGLDQPIWKQYIIYLGQMFQGDFGDSLFSGLPVMQEIGERLPATIELALFSVLIASVLGVSLGVICAVKQNSALDRICQVGGLVGVSLPKFWLGLMLIILFAVNLGWLPVSGRFDFMNRPETITGFMILDSIITGNWAALGSTLRYMLLPGVSIAIASVGTIMRYTRSTMLETIRQDYIRTARAKGLRERVVIIHHALKNALIPIVTVIGMELGGLFSGSVLVETIFAWPGVGKYIVDGINNSDYAVVQGGCVLVAVIAVGMNLVVDLLYGLLDPRIRY